jgi:hypothetical protein
MQASLKTLINSDWSERSLAKVSTMRDKSATERASLSSHAEQIAGIDEIKDPPKLVRCLAVPLRFSEQ